MWLSVEASGSAPQSCTRTAMGGTQPIDIYMAQLWPVLCQSRSVLCEPVVEKLSFSYHLNADILIIFHNFLTRR